VRLKLEITQVTGSFKVRGAMNALASLRESRPDVRRVVTASAGNHGQAVALSASRLGLSARVFVPATAPAGKRDAIRRLGAEMIEAPSYDDAEAMARATALDADAVFVSAYSHPDVIAGAGTIALEMFEDDPALDLIIVPLGGGGLASGVAIAAHGSRRPVPVMAVEAAASPVFTSALAAGRIVTVDVKPTLADGLAGNMEPDSQTFEIVRDLVERVVAVDEARLADAMRGLIEHEHLIVEGAGAAAVAGLLSGALDLAGRRIGVVLSGRNVDEPVVRRILAETRTPT
jgi:threonine dehydratase